MRFPGRRKYGRLAAMKRTLPIFAALAAASLAPAFRDFDSFDEAGKTVDDVAATGIAGILQGIGAGE